MKRILLLIPFVFIVQHALPKQRYDTLLVKLTTALDAKKQFDAEKLKGIENLKRQLSSPKNADLKFRYDIYEKLYNEYKSFDYHQAFNDVQKLKQISYALKDPVKEAQSNVYLGFILLSSGMFKEAFDSLKTVNVKLLPRSVRREYYYLTARTYYDLADFDKDDYYMPLYNTQAGKFIDSATALTQTNSFEYLYYNGLKYLKSGNTKKAVINLNALMSQYNLSPHEFAVTASTLSDIYIRENRPDSAINLLILATIADVRSSTKEAAAMLNLAQLLYQQGDLQNAYVFIKQAMDDAIYYGARQRKIQVSAILPVIAAKQINSVENERRILLLYASSLTVLAIIIISFATIVYKQLKKLRIADRVIIETNHNLQQSLNKLHEADKIKEEYLGYYFNLISEYISKLEKFKRSVDNKLTVKRYEDIRVLIDNINLNKEREELFINFDKAFLKIFPNFVSGFNSLFAEKNQIKLLPNQLLNTDLRIFALVRLGITDTEKIANILEYSVNTIYNYKARIKSRANIPKEEFEHAILAINAF